MRKVSLLIPLAALPACMGWVGGVRPDTAPEIETAEPDDTQPPEPDSWQGNGADGALELAETLILDADTRGDRDQPDAVSYRVTAIDGATLTLSEDALGLATGDELLLINLQGSASRSAAVGAFAFGLVAEVSGGELVLQQEPGVSFGEESSEDLSEQAVMAQRVPNYSSVLITSEGRLTVSDWDRRTGGVLAFRASEGLVVEAGGSLSVSGTGYAGGSTGSEWADGFQGESTVGPGIGGGTGSGYNESLGAYAPNAGGGGSNITGGGGSYGESGTPGDSWNQGYTAPQPGETYGEPDLGALLLGSGGGGIWNDGSGNAGPGGDGAGIILLTSASITLEGDAAIDARGDDTWAWSSGTYSYGAGGGSGGSVWLVAGSVQLDEGSVDARGGAGMDTPERAGGDGGGGRIRIDCGQCGGHEAGSTEAVEALNAAAEPDPGWSEPPS